MADRPFLLILVACASYILANAFFLAPLTGGTDSFVYLDAGVSLALGEGLTTQMGYGTPTLERSIFVAYPPGYPVLYGFFSWLVGPGPRADQWFNVLVVVLIVLGFWSFLSKGMTGKRERWLLALVLIVGLPAGLVGIASGRADGPGFLLALATFSYSAANIDRRGGLFLTAMLAGLTLLVSPFAALLAIGGAATFWFKKTQFSWRCLFMAAFIGAAGVFLPVFLALLPLQLSDSTYLARLFSIVSGFGVETLEGNRPSGAGVLIRLLQGDYEHYRSILVESFSTSTHWVALAAFLIAFTGSIAVLWSGRKERSAKENRWLLAILFILAVASNFIVPWQSNYRNLGALFMIVLIALSISDKPSSRASRQRTFLVAALGAMVLINAPYTALRFLAQMQMGSSYERMIAALATIPPLPKERPFFMVDQPAYLMVRQAGFSIVPTDHPLSFREDMREKMGYFAFAYPGSRDPMKPHRPDWWDPTGMTLVYKPDLPQQTMLFGFTISNSSQTWELEIWRNDRPLP